jgi:threonine aldolase
MSALDYQFASDNTAGICPEAWAALAEANQGTAAGYGSDEYCQRARRQMAEVFETDCEVFFVFNGTAANALALGATGRSHESILCHESAHIDGDECGAPEFFTGGSKVIALPGAHGKLSIPAVEAALERGHGFHYPKPGTLSLTQSTESGTLYRPEETAALAELAHRRGLRVHMDGARFANAAAALQADGFSPADLTWRAGVDVLSFGGTKNGMLTTEAIVFFKKELAQDFAYRVKQGGQVGSKQRFAGAQWLAMLKDGAWLRHAAHGNRCATQLADRVRAAGKVPVMFQPDVNAVFLELTPELVRRLESRWAFYKFFGEHGYRFMCSWATQPAAVEELITALV